MYVHRVLYVCMCVRACVCISANRHSRWNSPHMRMYICTQLPRHVQTPIATHEAGLVGVHRYIGTVCRDVECVLTYIEYADVSHICPESALLCMYICTNRLSPGNSLPIPRDLHERKGATGERARMRLKSLGKIMSQRRGRHGGWRSARLGSAQFGWGRQKGRDRCCCTRPYTTARSARIGWAITAIAIAVLIFVATASE